MRTLYTVAVVAALVSTPALAKEYVVKMKFNEETGEVFFEPKRLDIRSGDRVTWIQEDRDNPHNVVAYPNRIPKGTEPFTGPMLRRSGQRWSKVFAKSGTYQYHCHPHEQVGMRGMVVVDRESRAGEFRMMGKGEHSHAESSMHDVAETLEHGMRKNGRDLH